MLYQSKIKVKALLWHSHLLSLNIDTRGSNLLDDFQNLFYTKISKLKKIKDLELILCCKRSFVAFCQFLLVSLLRNHNSNLCNDHSNRINVLRQIAAPSMPFKFSGAKAKQTVKLYQMAMSVIFFYVGQLCVGEKEQGPIF